MLPLGNQRTDPLAEGLYCEPQERALCAAHALNAMLGKRVVHPEQMLTHLQHSWPAGEKAGHYDAAGNLSLSSINRWLWEHCTLERVALTEFGFIRPQPREMQRMLNNLRRQGCTRVIMHSP